MQVVINTDDGETRIVINEGEGAAPDTVGGREAREPSAEDRFDKSTAIDAGTPSQRMFEPNGESPPETQVETDTGPQSAGGQPSGLHSAGAYQEGHSR